MTSTKSNNYRNWFDTIGCLLGWFSVIGQFILMIQNRQADVLETTIRFFSFFTILTNILVAIYFTARLSVFNTSSFGIIKKEGTITSLTAFILVVGLVYQLILRATWKPTGLQIVVDEMLHSVIPLFTLFYWFKFATSADLKFQKLKSWLIYPLFYFVYIIIRGHFSNFYPYPFINAAVIGYFQVMINFIVISLFFITIINVLIFIGNKTRK